MFKTDHLPLGDLDNGSDFTHLLFAGWYLNEYSSNETLITDFT